VTAGMVRTHVHSSSDSRLGEGTGGCADDIALQGNVDPIILFSDKESISAKVKETVRKGRAAGGSKHVLNLGHGVLVGTPEESVAHFFETNRNTLYKEL
jgi:uroporphyrinogen decarboxylase